MTMPPSCSPATRRISRICGPPASRNKQRLESGPVFQPLEGFGRDLVSGGGVVFQMRDHCRFIRSVEAVVLEQGAPAALYAAAGLVNHVDVAIRAQAADRHVS